jgi:AmiR/NasT family two-component response regulator
VETRGCCLITKPISIAKSGANHFDDHDVAIASVFAAHAAVAWSTSQTIENLKGGMQSRQLIGQAVGLLRARQNMTEDEALNALRRASQRLNVKVRQIAERIVHPEASQ